MFTSLLEYRLVSVSIRCMFCVGHDIFLCVITYVQVEMHNREMLENLKNADDSSTASVASHPKVDEPKPGSKAQVQLGEGRWGGNVSKLFSVQVLFHSIYDLWNDCGGQKSKALYISVIRFFSYWFIEWLIDWSIYLLLKKSFMCSFICLVNFVCIYFIASFDLAW